MFYTVTKLLVGDSALSGNRHGPVFDRRNARKRLRSVLVEGVTATVRRASSRCESDPKCSMRSLVGSFAISQRMMNQVLCLDAQQGVNSLTGTSGVIVL